ncbi:hypothetical protein [Clostridium sp. LIBA-8841]|uniref:hypothetical protein n=1 Tax=Clostridium sp. LIBA-8841 TaxID=2987530 RepID=UPI002AC68BD7|nr:hypothetical protein [Clostridium sp. LIBA-8841]MDZ5253590.1 hypothetical protein [Clostridium sp. LIBA-8841]
MKEKINLKILNLAAWITIILTFITPFELNSGGFKTWGFPFKYFTTYDFPQDSNTLLFSTSTNIGGLFSNIVLIYLFITILLFLKEKLKKHNSSTE